MAVVLNFCVVLSEIVNYYLIQFSSCEISLWAATLELTHTEAVDLFITNTLVHSYLNMNHYDSSPLYRT
jgi:hypothetical protein